MFTLVACADAQAILATESPRAGQVDAIIRNEVCANFPHKRASHSWPQAAQDMVIADNAVRLNVYHCPDETP